jgi:hypothetical protein
MFWLQIRVIRRIRGSKSLYENAFHETTSG